MLDGLDKSPVRDTFVAGKHETSASGVCRQYNVGYKSADDKTSLQEGIKWLLEEKSERPLLLEVNTCVEIDEEELKRFYAHICAH